MKRELLKRLSTGVDVFEDVCINGHDVPLIFKGTACNFVCIDDVICDEAAVELYDSVARWFGLSNNRLFLFKMSDGVKGSFYCGKNAFVSEENIYTTYETCHLFTSKFILGNKPAYMAVNS